MYEQILKQAGLTDKQARVYLACLELGKTKVPAIARGSKIKRTTVYGILDELAALGLVVASNKGRAKFFQAQPPETITDILEIRKKEVEAILPDLKNVFAHKNIRPQIQFFEGKTGIERVFEDTLKCRDKKIRQIVRVKDFIEVVGKSYSESYIQRRSERAITSYALHPATGDIYNAIYGEESARFKRYVRYLPADMFYASMIMIYDHKVAMISTKAENFAFIIDSKEFSNTLGAYFEFLWNIGKKQVG